MIARDSAMARVRAPASPWRPNTRIAACWIVLRVSADRACRRSVTGAFKTSTST